ncbi:unnamed protein product [Closterium sp. NIES-65]|nr:unnamed protein product [Closterium sp. NIES-65]
MLYTSPHPRSSCPPPSPTLSTAPSVVVPTAAPSVGVEVRVSAWQQRGRRAGGLGEGAGQGGGEQVSVRWRGVASSNDVWRSGSEGSSSSSSWGNGSGGSGSRRRQAGSSRCSGGAWRGVCGAARPVLWLPGTHGCEKRCRTPRAGRRAVRAVSGEAGMEQQGGEVSNEEAGEEVVGRGSQVGQGVALGALEKEKGKEEGKEKEKEGTWASSSHHVLFCSQCGSPTNLIVPPGDDKPRDVCSSERCGRVHYANPKVVVGALCLWEGKVLLCRRGIPPCEGMWGFPQGFLELGESSREGAEREVREEACAEVRVRSLLAVYNIPNQVQIIYLADLLSPHCAAGSETLEAGLFEWDDVPFPDLAFPTVAWALEHARQQLQHPQAVIQPQLRTKVVGTTGMFSGSYVDA